MGWTLVTNDDGVDSPALVPFAEAIASLPGVDEIRVVVPDSERSWVGKAITRYEPVTVAEVERDGIPIWTCSGFPADAVQLGVHALFDRVPDLVVSGVNLGYNHGTGFLLSSGTVGAAIEGWIAGVPGIAVSTGTLERWHEWRERIHRPESRPAWERTARTAADLVAEVVDSGLGDHADVVSINLPFDPPADVARSVTSLARVGYDRLFGPGEGPGSYVHAFGGGFRELERLDGSDVAAANEGAIAITPLRMPAAADVPDSIRRRLDRA